MRVSRVWEPDQGLIIGTARGWRGAATASVASRYDDDANATPGRGVFVGAGGAEQRILLPAPPQQAPGLGTWLARPLREDAIVSAVSHGPTWGTLAARRAFVGAAGRPHAPVAAGIAIASSDGDIHQLVHVVEPGGAARVELWSGMLGWGASPLHSVPVPDAEGTLQMTVSQGLVTTAWIGSGGLVAIAVEQAPPLAAVGLTAMQLADAPLAFASLSSFRIRPVAWVPPPLEQAFVIHTAASVAWDPASLVVTERHASRVEVQLSTVAGPGGEPLFTGAWHDLASGPPPAVVSSNQLFVAVRIASAAAGAPAELVRVAIDGDAPDAPTTAAATDLVAHADPDRVVLAWRGPASGFSPSSWRLTRRDPRGATVITARVTAGVHRFEDRGAKPPSATYIVEPIDAVGAAGPPAEVSIAVPAPRTLAGAHHWQSGGPVCVLDDLAAGAPGATDVLTIDGGVIVAVAEGRHLRFGDDAAAGTTSTLAVNGAAAAEVAIVPLPFACPDLDGQRRPWTRGWAGLHVARSCTADLHGLVLVGGGDDPADLDGAALRSTSPQLQIQDLAVLAGTGVTIAASPAGPLQRILVAGGGGLRAAVPGGSVAFEDVVVVDAIEEAVLIEDGAVAFERFVLVAPGQAAVRTEGALTMRGGDLFGSEAGAAVAQVAGAATLDGCHIDLPAGAAVGVGAVHATSPAPAPLHAHGGTAPTGFMPPDGPAVVSVAGTPGDRLEVIADGDLAGHGAIGLGGDGYVVLERGVTAGTLRAIAPSGVERWSLVFGGPAMTLATAAGARLALRAPPSGARFAATGGQTAIDVEVEVTGPIDPATTIVAADTGASAALDAAGRATLTLAVGAHTLRASGRDAAGDPVASPAIAIEIGATLPASPVIVTPADGEVVGTPEIQVTGTAAAGASVLLAVEDGTEVTADVDSTGAFTAVLAAPPGPCRLLARAIDAAGLASATTAPRAVIVAPEAPRVDVDTPRADLVTRADGTPIFAIVTTPLDVTVTAAGVALAVVESTDTLESSPFGDGWTRRHACYLADLPLAPGANAIAVEATDTIGRTTRVDVAVTRRPPTLAIDLQEPPAEVPVSGGVIAVLGVVDDEVSHVWVNGLPAALTVDRAGPTPRTGFLLRGVPVAVGPTSLVVVAQAPDGTRGILERVLPVEPDAVGLSRTIPDEGGPGTTVALHGYGFSPEPGQTFIAFSGAPEVEATEVSADGTLAEVVVPAGVASASPAAPGTASVRVRVRGGISGDLPFRIPVLAGLDLFPPRLDFMRLGALARPIATAHYQLGGATHRRDVTDLVTWIDDTTAPVHRIGPSSFRAAQLGTGSLDALLDQHAASIDVTVSAPAVVVVLVLDYSDSMREPPGATEPLRLLKHAATGLLQAMRPGDVAGLITFARQVSPPVTSDLPGTLVPELDGRATAAGTALYSAVITGLALLAAEQRTRPDSRGVLVVVSDGESNAGATLAQAAAAFTAPVLAYFAYVESQESTSRVAGADLAALARVTGSHFRSAPAGQLAALFDEIATVIHQEPYELAFTRDPISLDRGAPDHLAVSASFPSGPTLNLLDATRAARPTFATTDDREIAVTPADGQIVATTAGRHAVAAADLGLATRCTALVDQPPEIREAFPSPPTAGATVVLEGSGFSDETAAVTVLFEGRGQHVLASTRELIRFVLEDGAGPGNLTVVVGGRSSPPIRVQPGAAAGVAPVDILPGHRRVFLRATGATPADAVVAVQRVRRRDGQRSSATVQLVDGIAEDGLYDPESYDVRVALRTPAGDADFAAAVTVAPIATHATLTLEKLPRSGGFGEDVTLTLTDAAGAPLAGEDLVVLADPALDVGAAPPQVGAAGSATFSIIADPGVTSSVLVPVTFLWGPLARAHKTRPFSPGQLARMAVREDLEHGFDGTHVTFRNHDPRLGPLDPFASRPFRIRIPIVAEDLMLRVEDFFAPSTRDVHIPGFDVIRKPLDNPSFVASVLTNRTFDDGTPRQVNPNAGALPGIRPGAIVGELFLALAPGGDLLDLARMAYDHYALHQNVSAFELLLAIVGLILDIGTLLLIPIAAIGSVAVGVIKVAIKVVNKINARIIEALVKSADDAMQLARMCADMVPNLGDTLTAGTYSTCVAAVGKISRRILKVGEFGEAGREAIQFAGKNGVRLDAAGSIADGDEVLAGMASVFKRDTLVPDIVVTNPEAACRLLLATPNREIGRAALVVLSGWRRASLTDKGIEGLIGFMGAFDDVEKGVTTMRRLVNKMNQTRDWNRHVNAMLENVQEITKLSPPPRNLDQVLRSLPTQNTTMYGGFGALHAAANVPHGERLIEFEHVIAGARPDLLLRRGNIDILGEVKVFADPDRFDALVRIVGSASGNVADSAYRKNVLNKLLMGHGRKQARKIVETASMSGAEVRYMIGYKIAGKPAQLSQRQLDHLRDILSLEYWPGTSPSRIAVVLLP